MQLRRGFKTEAEAIGVEIRSELGLRVHDRLDPFALADHLAIPVVALSALRAAAPDAAAHLLDVEPKAFSAITVFRGRHRQIVYNDQHSPGRQNSSVGHELAHGLLLHEPHRALDDAGCRLWDQEMEEEANWLAGVLLIPADAALAIARQGVSELVATERFGVSEQMLTWRLNATGARKRVERARVRWGGR